MGKSRPGPAPASRFVRAAGTAATSSAGELRHVDDLVVALLVPVGAEVEPVGGLALADRGEGLEAGGDEGGADDVDRPVALAVDVGLDFVAGDLGLVDVVGSAAAAPGPTVVVVLFDAGAEGLTEEHRGVAVEDEEALGGEVRTHRRERPPEVTVLGQVV